MTIFSYFKLFQSFFVFDFKLYFIKCTFLIFFIPLIKNKQFNNFVNFFIFNV